MLSRISLAPQHVRLPRMRRILLAAGGLVAACGSDHPAPPVDAMLQVVDGVILYPDAPLPDAVSATTGAIMVTVQCGGAGCGKSGYLHLALDDCKGGATIASKTQPNRTLTAGVDLTATFDALMPAAYCVTGYLDVNANFMLDAGDVIAQAGAAHATVVAGQVAPATLVLDTIK
jgi:hypothetical protein